MRWEEMARIDIDGPGRGIRIRQKAPMGAVRRWVGLAGCQNGVLAHHVIEHAAAGPGVAIHRVSRLLPRG